MRTWISLLAMLLLTTGSAEGVTVDLTGGTGTSGTINGVLFAFDDQQPAGTGVLDSFLRIQSNGTEEGYNTSNPAFPFDEVPPAGGFTRNLQFSELVNIGGDFLFTLDINEPSGGTQSLLSLDALQIYISDTGSQNTTILGDQGTLFYDLDAGADSTVLMDYDNASGSGVTDMLMALPASLFAGVDPGDFMILYSRFGDTESSGAGYEEWAQVIPEPRAALLIGVGLASLAIARRR